MEAELCPPKHHQTRSAGVERLGLTSDPVRKHSKKSWAHPYCGMRQPAQKKVYGFRDLLRSFSCSLAGDSAEHNDVRVGIAAQTVCAVRDARHFTRSQSPGITLPSAVSACAFSLMRTPPIVWCTLGTALMT